MQADPNFVEGNLKHSINGFFFCNMPMVSDSEMVLATMLSPSSLNEPKCKQPASALQLHGVHRCVCRVRTLSVCCPDTHRALR